jgi:hypothetical protein
MHRLFTLTINLLQFLFSFKVILLSIPLFFLLLTIMAITANSISTTTFALLTLGLLFFGFYYFFSIVITIIKGVIFVISKCNSLKDRILKAGSYGKGSNKNINESSLVYDFTASFQVIINDIMPKITKYYPFSLFWRGELFHYNNRNINYVKNIIDVVSYKTGAYFFPTYIEEDNYFVTVHGKIKSVNKYKKEDKFIKNLQKIFGENNIFVREKNKSEKIFLISQNAITLE